MVPTQVAALGRSRRACEACGRTLVSKGHYGATFRFLFGDVPVRVRRRLACPCRGASGAPSRTVLKLGRTALAPELAYVTARYAAIAPFGKVATLPSELLSISGTQHASTVRNISMSGRRNCYDNAMVETFFRTLKAEPVWRTVFQTRAEAHDALARYIDGFCKPIRRHSALQYVSPAQFERRVASLTALH